MEALVMAGGRGERMGRVEKPMVMLEGKPLLAYVMRALLGSHAISHVYVAVSPNVPLTADFVRNYPDERVSPVMTPGYGYVEDAAYAARALKLNEPFLVLSADLPLVTPEIIDRIVAEYERCGREALSVKTVKDGVAMPAGINILHGACMDRAQDEHTIVLSDAMLINVNYRKDLTVCESLMMRR